MINQEELKKNLHYCEETGVFRWRRETSRRVIMGSVAGTVMNSGYIMVRINHSSCLAHRLAFVYMGVDIGPNEVDHIDRIKTNNSWKNLRIVTHIENCQNLPMNPRNTSGYNGVSWNKKTNKWYAYVKIEGKQINLGNFHEKKDAVDAREIANIEHGFHENHGAK